MGSSVVWSSGGGGGEVVTRWSSKSVSQSCLNFSSPFYWEVAPDVLLHDV